MITQPMSRKAFDVQVPPKQQQKTKEKPSSQIVLELKADGSYAINGQPYAASQLEQAFHQIYDQRPAKLLFIKAAPNRKYLDVMEAMDAAHGAGARGPGGGAGRREVTFSPLPTPGPAAVDVPVAPAVALSDLRSLPQLRLDVPLLEVPRETLRLALAGAATANPGQAAGTDGRGGTGAGGAGGGTGAGLGPRMGAE